METTRYTNSGIPYKVIKEVQGSPLSQLLKIGRDMQIKEIMERPMKRKLTFNEELEKIKIVEEMKREFGNKEYLSLEEN